MYVCGVEGLLTDDLVSRFEVIQARLQVGTKLCGALQTDTGAVVSSLRRYVKFP